MKIRFVLKGELGATQFLMFSGWYLPKNQEEHKINHWDTAPMGADIGYHSPKPMYEGDRPIADSCPYLDGKPCYYGGSGMAAETLFNKFVAEGVDVVWKELEDYYTAVFGELK